MTVPKFSGTHHSLHAELKAKINEYFVQVGRSSTGNYQLFIKAVVLTLAFIAIYIHLVFLTPAVIWQVFESILLGGIVAAIGFNVMHDGGHGSFSKYKWVNNVAAFSLNLLGGSSFMWNVKHNVIHHAYTNIDGVDDDIDIQPWMRMSSTQPKLKMHKYQHFYFWFLYSMLYILWVFVLDYQKYFKRKIGHMPLKKMSAWDHIIFWGFKALYLFLFFLIPFYTVGVLPTIIGFLIFSVVAGFILSIVFQLAHTVEHTHFPVPHDESGKLDDEWAIHQLKTTANFAPKNKLISWLVGGLNYQIEHHLFPKISHVHYPAIRKIIKQACSEFNVPYTEYKKMSHAVISHVLFLKQMGRA